MNIRLKTTDKIKIQSPDEIFEIMQRILLKESPGDRKREHFWVVSLDWGNTILNIELVSLGTYNETLVKPMEVLSIPLQKKAVKLILVHNHPSGNLEPSEGDKVVTDRLIQACKIMQIDIEDHLIITERSYYSFHSSGLMDELRKSKRFVPAYEQKRQFEEQMAEELKQKAHKEKEKEIVLRMRSEGCDIETIMRFTGLTKAQINRIKE